MPAWRWRVDGTQARYLGDLAPAAQAVAGQLSESTLETAEAVATETARLSAEKERLTALLYGDPDGDGAGQRRAPDHAL